MACHNGETSIAIGIKEKWFPIFPQTLVGMHARTVITVNWFGHKSDGLAILAGRIFDNIFVQEQFVSGSDEAIEAEVDFGLTCCANLVVMGLNRDAKCLKVENHLCAQILIGITWWDREIAT